MSMKGSIRIYSEEHGWLVYLVLFVYVFIFYLIFSWLDLFQTNPDSARYMLSALVQSEAAIVAIVITLSLVAVQLTASSYSPRVTEIFRKAPDLWILMISYIAAIIYGLGVLKLIEATPEVNLECCIRIAYFSGIFCFIALLPYTYNMFEMLKPSTVIKKLSEKITKENLLKAEKNPEADPIQPIIDIIRGSMMKYDYETLTLGLREIRSRIYDLLNKENLDENQEVIKKDWRKIAGIIRKHFIRLGKLAVNREDEDSCYEIIEKTRTIALKGIERENNILVVEMSLILKIIGREAIKRKMEHITIEVITSLGEMGVTLLKFGNDILRTGNLVAFHIGEMGIISLKNKFTIPVKTAINYLVEIAINSFEKYPFLGKTSSSLLEEIKRNALKKNRKRIMPYIDQSIEEVKFHKKECGDESI